MTVGSPAAEPVHPCICCLSTFTEDPLCAYCDRAGCDELENVGRPCPKPKLRVLQGGKSE